MNWEIENEIELNYFDEKNRCVTFFSFWKKLKKITIFHPKLTFLRELPFPPFRRHHFFSSYQKFETKNRNMDVQIIFDSLHRVQVRKYNRKVVGSIPVTGINYDTQVSIVSCLQNWWFRKKLVIIYKNIYQAYKTT